MLCTCDPHARKCKRPLNELLHVLSKLLFIFSTQHPHCTLFTELLRLLRDVNYPLNIGGDLLLIFVRIELWVRQIKYLGRTQRLKRYSGYEVANVVLNKYGSVDYKWGIKSASTDFVSH